MLLTARSAMKRFPLTTLIRLYELLKNSRLIDGYRSTTKKPRDLSMLKAALVLKLMGWWRMTGSNRRPPACKAGALPAELIPQIRLDGMVGLGGLEPPTPALSRRCSNQLSYRPGAGRCRRGEQFVVAGDIFQQPISVDV